MNQGRQSVSPSPLPDSKRRELCKHHDEADQRPETSSRRFTERGRHTPRTEERVWDESGEDERTERQERVTQEWSPRPSPVLWLTSAHLSPGQPPPIPTTRIPASAANVPSSAAVTVHCPVIGSNRSSNFKPKKIPLEVRTLRRAQLTSSGSMIGSCWMLMGWRRLSMRSYFPKEVLWGKDTELDMLFKIGTVGDEEDNEMNEAEWYELINLLKILFVMSSIFYSIVRLWRPSPTWSQPVNRVQILFLPISLNSSLCIVSTALSLRGPCGLVTLSRTSPDISQPRPAQGQSLSS